MVKLSILGLKQKLLEPLLGLKLQKTMTQFNIKNFNNIEDNYQLGLLPQRNQKNNWYSESSSRSNLAEFKLSSENRRILNKTSDFSFEKIKLSDFNYNSDVQKQIFQWLKELEWDFPISSVKQIFTNHIFNYVYVWKTADNQIAAYSICYFSKSISHIAYVFYSPKFNHDNLPIRLVLQTIIDSYQDNLKFCYLGRFSQNTGFYKRNMPGFEYFKENSWLTL
jgi:arginyl-tRNA--protein-N-Asp/Glu arginylyltransferase